MTDAGTPRLLQGWQRANVVTAAIYLRELLARSPGDVRLRAVHDGLVEALDPARRGVRLQRESHESAAAAKMAVRVDKRAVADRRHADRRSGVDRRVVGLGAPGGKERRVGERRREERRSGQDRRRR